MLQDIVEMRAKIAGYETDMADITAALEAAQVEALGVAKAAVAKLIEESGFTQAQVLGEVSAPSVKAHDPAKDGRKFPLYALKSDPTKAYSRGRLPAWLSDAMTSRGYDPESSKEREEFRTLHMVKV